MRPRSIAMASPLGLALGYAADRFFADPQRHHPVAIFGKIATLLENRIYAPDRTRGIAYCATLVGGSALLGGLIARASAGHRVLHVVVTATATWVVLGGRSLEREAHAVHMLLMLNDLAGARERVTHLVGRDPSHLGEPEIARATVESVAENTSDAVVAPLIAGAVAGIPGLLAYRASNTLDAMVGHRSERYEAFGWASARLDDVFNVVPARLSGALAAIAAPVVGGRPGDAARVWRRDAGRHPSPNAGPVEAAFAGALGISLGGKNVYGSVVEDRGTLGDGPPAQPKDVPRSTRLAAWVGNGTLAVAMAVATLRSRR